jgi:hypothetical protein
MTEEQKTLEDQKREIEQEIEDYKKGKEIDELKGKLDKAKEQDEWKEKHKGFMKLQKKTKAIEEGVKGLFKGLGKAFVKGAKALEKSDQWIAEQQRKENAINKSQQTVNNPVPKKLLKKVKNKKLRSQLENQFKGREHTINKGEKKQSSDMEDVLMGID